MTVNLRLLLKSVLISFILMTSSQARVVDEEGKQCIKAIYQTNYNSDFAPQDEIKNNEVDTPIFNNGYVLYSKEFAEKFGFSEEYVSSELNEGMDVVEYRVVTDGGSNRCRLNVLLKSGQGLDLPKEDIVMRYQRRGMRIRFPKRESIGEGYFGQQGYGKKASDAEKAEHYFSRNIRISTAGYDFRKRGASESQFLREYSNEYYEGYDYLSLSIGCRGGTQKILKKYDATLWLKLKGGKDYRKVNKVDRSEFKIYQIPKSFQEVVKELTQDVHSHDHFRALRLYDSKKGGALCQELVEKDKVR